MENSALGTGKLYLKEVFGQDQFFNIPEYQRSYSWGEDHIVTLLSDINNAMNLINQKEYFLGCMIWNTRNAQGNNNVEYLCQDILDGQQRFLTLYLLHAVIRDLSDTQTLKENVQRRLVQEEDLYSNIPSRHRIEFEIRDDKEFLDEFVVTPRGTSREDKLSQICHNDKKTTSVRNLAAGILAIRRWWRNSIDTKNENLQQQLSKFYTYLSNRVLILYLSTPNNLDDAYNLFTVVNSRGQKLQISDIIKAQNLRVIEDEHQRKLYAKKWSEFESTISAPYQDFDDFLRTTFDIHIKYNGEENKNLTKAFESIVKQGHFKPGKEALDAIGKYVRHFGSLMDRSITDKLAPHLFGDLNLLLSTLCGRQHLQLLMYYRECFHEYMILDFMIKIDNLLSAFWLIGRNPSASRLFDILREMENYKKMADTGRLSPENAAAKFLQHPCLEYGYYNPKLSTERPLDLNEVFEFISTQKWGAVVGVRVNKTKYLLLKIDLLMSKRNSMLRFQKQGCQVERILTQNKIQPEMGFDNGEESLSWINRLGNLAMVDKPKMFPNNQLNYQEKRNSYNTFIEQRPNARHIFSTHSAWDLDSIQENHERVIDLLRQYYTGNSWRTFLELMGNGREIALVK